MIGRFSEDQRLAGTDGDAENDQRRAVLRGLPKNSVAPVSRRAAADAHDMVARLRGSAISRSLFHGPAKECANSVEQTGALRIFVEA